MPQQHTFIHKVLLYFKGEPGQVAQVSKGVTILSEMSNNRCSAGKEMADHIQYSTCQRCLITGAIANLVANVSYLKG